MILDPFSARTKEAIKTALAMTIAYGIALQMGWAEPMWAGFAVAFISLATAGQSLNKAALRMLGTFMAAAVALLIIALFPQERWTFMLILSLWVGFCTYMMGGSNHQYFWHVSAFACVIICVDGGIDPINAFDTAMLRTQETGLGILVYSLVAIFLWPVNAHADFVAITGELASQQQQLYRAYMDLMKLQGVGDGSKDKSGNDSKERDLQVQALQGKVLQTQNRFEQLLGAAATDSYEIWEMRRQWQQYRHQAIELSNVLELWRESYVDIQDLDLPAILPGLTDFSDEIDQRFTRLDQLLTGKASSFKPKAVELIADKKSLAKLSSFHKAALVVIVSRLQQVERLSLSLIETMLDIRGIQEPAVLDNDVVTGSREFALDLDRLTASIRVITAVWLAFLAIVYVSDLPGGMGLISMLVPMIMALANMPQMSVSKLFIPASVGLLTASLLYIFVMPQLSSFNELGLLLFIVTFIYCYLFSKPQQVLGRALGLALFASIASISNEQSYSIFAVTTPMLMFPLVFIIIAITAYIPFSPHPERAYMRLLRRFFRSSEYLVSTLHPGTEQQRGWISCWRRNFHLHELNTLPQKLMVWSKFIDTKNLSGTTPENVQKLNSNLRSLAYRLQELQVSSNSSQSELLAGELQPDIHGWRLRVLEVLNQLAVNPSFGKEDKLQAGLSSIIEHMERRIKESLDKLPEEQISSQETQNFYHLLGSYRGVSEALVEFAGSTDAINWPRWREERF